MRKWLKRIAIGLVVSVVAVTALSLAFAPDPVSRRPGLKYGIPLPNYKSTRSARPARQAKEGNPQPADPVVTACREASNGDTGATRKLSSLEPGQGIGPLARLTLRAEKSGQHQKAAHYRTLLQNACDRY